jgi:carbamoyltransferase
MAEIILGISAYYHDSASAIIIDGKIVAAAHEERFTRIKQDSSFPTNSIEYVIEEANIDLEDITSIAFYDKPFIKFERLLETYHAFAPAGLASFSKAIPVWIKEKLFTKHILKKEFKKIGLTNYQLYFPEHHLSHAASAYYPSPYEEAAILTIDGVGEWATMTICKGQGSDITVLKELRFPHSVGLLYSAFTYFLGFKVNSGEYKLMGLAPYGNTNDQETKEFKSKIYEELVDVRVDGSVLLNMKYFTYSTELRMVDDNLFHKLFGMPKKHADDPMTQSHMNLALAIQEVTEEIVFKLAATAKELTNCDNLVLAGGVALNSVINGKLLKSGPFKNIWVQPAAGDSGGALGAALAVNYIAKKNTRISSGEFDEMNGSYLGPEFSEKEIVRVCKRYDAKYEKHEDFEELVQTVAGHLADGKVVGWFQGRMEYGPRSLGARSILGDARNSEMQKKMNLKIKYREGFRPFAPSVLEEDVRDYYDIETPSPYMLFVVPVNEKRRKELPANYNDLELLDRLYIDRSDIPAITHVDFSARIQTVSKKTNYRFWKLINEFKNQTGFGTVINTSFNVRGEPIVCTPDDGYRCFMRTEMDYLVLGDYIFDKTKQKELKNDSNWREEFALD